MKPQWGYLYITLAAVLWAVSGSAAKFLFHGGVSAFQVVQMRLTISAALLFLWLLFRSRERLRVRAGDAGYFLLLGWAGVALNQFSYLFTISRIHVAAAILLQYLGPSLIALYLVVFARERINRLTVTALVLAALGCYLVVGAYNLDALSLNRLGILSGLVSAISFAAYSLLSEYGMRRYGPWTVLCYALASAAVAWNLFLPPLSAFAGGYTAAQWGWILYIGVLGTLVPFGLYLMGINLIRSTRASITATLEPITAGVVAYLFLGEAMAPLQILGGIMVIASVVVLQLKREIDENAPAALRARRETPA